jgi:thioglycine synthase
MRYKRDEKWQFMFSSGTNKIIEFSEITTHMNYHIKDDINLLLDSLKKAKLKRVIIVDLTDPNICMPVIRGDSPRTLNF